MLSQAKIELDQILSQYSKTANSDPDALRLLIPPQEIWRFFVDGRLQHGRTVLLSRLDNWLSPKQKEQKNSESKISIKIDYGSVHVKNVFKGWLPFDCEEPGSVKAFHSAFQEIFNRKQIVSHDFIKKLHFIAVNTVVNTNYRSSNGQSRHPCYEYTDGDSSFELNYKNMTQQGVLEFLNKNNPYAFIQLPSSPKIKLDSKTIAAYRKSKPLKRDYSTSPADQLIYCLVHSKNNAEAADWIYKYREKNMYKFCFETKGDRIKKTTPLLQKQFDIYHTAIKKTKEASIERLFAIINLVQSCEQLHPFKDGNCRTFCMLLLNHLLIQNGFPLAILEDPNQFDLYSQHELLLKVLEGMKNTFHLIREGELYQVNTTSLSDEIAQVEGFEAFSNYFNECIKIEMAGRAKEVECKPEDFLTSSTLEEKQYHSMQKTTLPEDLAFFKSVNVLQKSHLSIMAELVSQIKWSNPFSFHNKISK